MGGDTKVLSNDAAVGKSLGKAIYLFSPDVEGGKVGHVNYLPKEVLERKVLDAKTWLNEVSAVLGGKVCAIMYCIGESPRTLNEGEG